MEKIKYLNGDATLFFRNKINRLKDDTDIVKYIEKRVGKKYTVSAETVNKEIIKRELSILSYVLDKNKIEITTKANGACYEGKMNVYFYETPLAKNIETITY